MPPGRHVPLHRPDLVLGFGSRSRTRRSRTAACGPSPAATAGRCASASRVRPARRHRSSRRSTRAPLPEPGDGRLVPLEVAAGTLVVLHGLLPHYSGPNRSPEVAPRLLAARDRRPRRVSRRQLAAAPATTCPSGGSAACERVPRSSPTIEPSGGRPKVLLHDHLDGGAAPDDGDRARARSTATTSCRPPTRRARAVVRAGRQPPRPRAVPRDVRPHRRRDADAPTRSMRVAAECAEDLAADGVVYAEVRLRPRAAPRGRADARRGRRGGARRASGAGQPGRAHGTIGLDRHRHAPRGALAGDRRARACATATRASSASTSRAPRPATRRPATSTRSARRRARTSTSRSTPARRSACRRSGRRCSCAAPSGSATASASSTTSRCDDDGPVQLGRLAELRARPAGAARDVPDVERAHRRGDTIAEHPIGLLRRLRFRVTVNTDNRLMSDVSMTSELAALRRGVRLRLGRPRVAHDQRDEELVLALRRAARDHQRPHQAGLRGAEGGRPRESASPGLDTRHWLVATYR